MDLGSHVGESKMTPDGETIAPSDVRRKLRQGSEIWNEAVEEARERGEALHPNFPAFRPVAMVVLALLGLSMYKFGLFDNFF